MSLFSIVFKSLKKRTFSTLLTILSVGLGVALVIAVQTLERETEKSYNQTSVGYDLILAAPGSRMQTTLNTIYHLETSTGIIPFGVFEAALNDPRIERAFPFYVGDSYRGFRVIGTTASFLDIAEPRAGQSFSFAEGRNFNQPWEVVIGYQTAERLGLSVGDRFYFTHGVVEPGAGAEPHVHDDSPVTIVGILEPTLTSNDRVIFTSVFTTHAVHSHEHHHPEHDDDHDDHEHDDHGHNHDHEGEHEHEDEDEHHSPDLAELEKLVTELDAVLIKMENSAAALQLAGMLNYPVPQNPILARNLMRDPFFPYKDDLMAVVPAMQIQELMSIVGNAEKVLRFIALLVFFVALIGVIVAIYNTMEERRRDIAIMRSLGARRTTISTLILLESGTITFLGCLLGLLLGLGIVQAVAPVIAETAGIVVTAGLCQNQIMTLLLFVVLGILAGLIPALKAYKTDVATNLNP